MNTLAIIVLTVCLHMAPDEIGPPWCRDYDPGFDPVPAFQCAVGGMAAAAQAMGDLPKYDFAGYRCRRLTPKARAA